jgi:hypothetical protein
MLMQLALWRSARASRSAATWNKEKVSLLHFPDELLLLVIEELGETELYTLCLVSKRCQRLALPAYLSHHGIAIDRLTLSVEQIIALPSPALRLAFFVSGTTSLFCEIVPMWNEGLVRTDVMNHLCRVFKKAHGVKRVTLRFARWHISRPKPWMDACIRFWKLSLNVARVCG